MRRAWRKPFGAVCAIPVLALGATTAGAQVLPRLAATPEPEAGIVAVALRVAGGSADDPVAQSGRTQLAALAALAAVQPALDSLGARAEAECGRTSTGFLLLAPPDTWETAARRFAAAVFAAAPDHDAIGRARKRLALSTRLENGNPTWQVRLLTRQALYGVSDPWTRPRCGVPETVGQIPDSAVAARAHAAFRPDRAVAAVNGPIDVQQAEQVFAEWFSASSPPAQAAPRALGDSTRVGERNTVTAWLGFAFPVERPVDPEALRMVASRLDDATQPSPDRPGVLGSSVELENPGGHPVLFVFLVTEPGDVHAWLARVPQLVQRYAGAPMPTTTFRQHLRRFRGIRLRQLATPDARARRNADAL
ncbi:MAG: hypothetical protein P8174_07235, partial [Gemmatimonadota bacterium]